MDIDELPGTREFAREMQENTGFLGGKILEENKLEVVEKRILTGIVGKDVFIQEF